MNGWISRPCRHDLTIIHKQARIKLIAPNPLNFSSLLTHVINKQRPVLSNTHPINQIDLSLMSSIPTVIVAYFT